MLFNYQLNQHENLKKRMSALARWTSTRKIEIAALFLSLIIAATGLVLAAIIFAALSLVTCNSYSVWRELSTLDFSKNLDDLII